MPAPPLVDLRTAGPDLLAEILKLNAANQRQTSPLDAVDLAALVAQAALAPARPDGRAFALVLPESAAYDSPNFLWLRQRFDRFLYVDRVVVEAGLRGTGAGRAIYEATFAAARMGGWPRVVAEVNRVPANPASDAFHAALGFREVGRGSPAPGKEVTYLAAELAPTPA